MFKIIDNNIETITVFQSCNGYNKAIPKKYISNKYYGKTSKFELMKTRIILLMHFILHGTKLAIWCISFLIKKEHDTIWQWYREHPYQSASQFGNGLNISNSRFLSHKTMQNLDFKKIYIKIK